MSFSHIEDSGHYECKVVDNDEQYIQFQVIVNANCESNQNCSSENSFSSINPTIDVSTTTSSELLQLEILQRIKSKVSGDGQIADQSYKGVCCSKSVVVGVFPFSIFLLYFVELMVFIYDRIYPNTPCHLIQTLWY